MDQTILGPSKSVLCKNSHFRCRLLLWSDQEHFCGHSNAQSKQFSIHPDIFHNIAVRWIGTFDDHAVETPSWCPELPENKE